MAATAAALEPEALGPAREALEPEASEREPAPAIRSSTLPAC